MGIRRVTAFQYLTKKAMGTFVLMAFLFLPPTLFAQTGTTAFYILQGDLNYRYVDRSQKPAKIVNTLQFEMLDEIREHAQSSEASNTVIFFDPPTEKHPFVEVYVQGELIHRHPMPEDFTDPATLAEVLWIGYKWAPANKYAMYFWNYTVPFYKDKGQDKSHPQNYYSVQKLAQSFKMAHSQQADRKFNVIALSTCYNSSIETLEALHPYTNNIVASQVYIPSHGLSPQALTEPTLDFISKSLDRIDRWTAKDTKTNLPLSEVSLSVLDTAQYGFFKIELYRYFNALSQIISQSEYQDDIQHAFASAKLKSADGLLDLNRLVYETMPLIPQDITHSLMEQFDQVVSVFNGGNIDNTYGLSFYFPFKSLKELVQISGESQNEFYADFLTILNEHYFEIFGIHTMDAYPNDLIELILMYPKGNIPASVVRKYLTAKQHKDADLTIAQLEDVEFIGKIEGQGIYFGRVGSHQLKLLQKRSIYLRSAHGQQHLDQFFSNQSTHQFKITGVLKLEKGLWLNSYSLILEVYDIKKIR